MSAPNFLRNGDSPNVPPIARGLSELQGKQVHNSIGLLERRKPAKLVSGITGCRQNRRIPYRDHWQSEMRLDCQVLTPESRDERLV